MRWLAFDIENPHGPMDRIGFALVVEDEGTHPRLVRTGSFTWNNATRALTRRLLVDNAEGADWLVAHNAPYDLGHLAEEGIVVPPARVFDTMQAAALLHPDLPKALGAMHRYLPDPTKPWKWESTARPAFYNAMDCEVTARIAPVLYRAHQDRGSLALLVRGILPSIYVIDRMTRTGIPVDTTKLRWWRANTQAKLNNLHAEWLDIAPLVSPTSPRQVAEFLYGTLGFPVLETTPTGLPSADEGDLSALAVLGERRRKAAGLSDTNFAIGKEIIRLRVEIAGTSNLLSTHSDESRIAPDGRLHPSYLPAKDSSKGGTAPGRLSSSPNVQNVPIEARVQFVPPRRGWVIVDTDMSAVEGRTQAALADDVDLLGAFADAGRDLHQENADAIHNALVGLWSTYPAGFRHRGSPGAWTRVAHRKPTKNFKYAWDYGASIPTLGKTLDLNRAETEAAVTAIESKWPVTTAWRERVVKLAVLRHHLVNPFGRRRSFHGVSSSDGMIRAHAKSQAINFLPQSCVADMFWMLFPIIEEVIHDFGGEFHTQVHDSVVWSVEASEVLDATLALGAILEREWPQIREGFWVPCAHAVGPSWGETTPYDAWVAAGSPVY